MPPNDRITLIKSNLLDFDDPEKFDTITCFLWNIPLPLYQNIMNKIKTLLKPDGCVFIGFHDYDYKYGSKKDNKQQSNALDTIVSNTVPNTGSVPELMVNNFSNTYILPTKDALQWIIKSKNPK